MIRRVLILSLLLLLILPVGGFAESDSDAPLTLLKKTDSAPQTAPGQANLDISDSNEELRDIYGPVATTERPPYLLLVGVICLVLLAAAALIWFLKKRTTPAPPPLPPWEQALLELTNARNLLNPERALASLAYMDRVSQILRTYIESRFAIQSTRQTTREFLQSLTGAVTSSPLQTYKSELQACLEQADMAKFAHHVPELTNLEKMAEAVTTFIKKTKPVEPAKGSRAKKHGKRSLQPGGSRS